MALELVRQPGFQGPDSPGEEGTVGAGGTWQCTAFPTEALAEAEAVRHRATPSERLCLGTKNLPFRVCKVARLWEGKIPEGKVRRNLFPVPRDFSAETLTVGRQRPGG